MADTRFTATLLRTSAGGFAGLTVTRTSARLGNGQLAGGFEAWHSHFLTLVLELAASLDGGNSEQFASRVAWTRDAFRSRNLDTELLRVGLEELGKVLEESLPGDAWTHVPKLLEGASKELARTPASSDGDPDLVGPLGELTMAYIAKLEEWNGPDAIGLVTAAVEQGRLTAGEALEGILTRALRAIGRMWHMNKLNIAQEHFATQTTGRLLEQLVLMAEHPTPNGRTVVLAMVEGDAHDLGLRIVAGLFELDGWRTICLGANTPPADLADMVVGLNVDLVVLGATLNTHREAAVRTVETLKQADSQRPVLVGGSAFHGLSETQADGCVLLPSDAVRMGRELLGI